MDNNNITKGMHMDNNNIIQGMHMDNNNITDNKSYCQLNKDDCIHSEQQSTQKGLDMP